MLLKYAIRYRKLFDSSLSLNKGENKEDYCLLYSWHSGPAFLSVGLTKNNFLMKVKYGVIYPGLSWFKRLQPAAQ